MGSSSGGGGGGGSSSSRSTGSSIASTVANAVLGPVGGSIVSGLGSLANSTSSTPATRSSSPGLSSSQQQSISALQNQYNQAMAAGDTASANDYHNLANQIRNSAGLKAGVDYNSDTGEMYGGQGANVSPTTSTTGIQPVTAPMQTPYDPTAQINALKEAQRQSRIAALDTARTNALSSLNSYKTNSLASLDTQKNSGLTQLQGEQSAIAPQYYDKRNQAAAASDVGAMNFAQYMAARNIKGPAGAMPEIYRNAGLQGQIGALDQAEAASNADIERRRSQLNTDYNTNVNALNQDYNQKSLDVNNNYNSDVTQANADVEAQAMQNYINQMNLNRQYDLQVGQATGDINGTPTLAAQQFEWGKSSSNPDVQAQLLANRKAALDNAAQEIQNSYLPDTLKLQAQALQQKVDAGSLDYDTALAQLDQIKAQTANYQRQANAPYSTGGSSKPTATDVKNSNYADAYDSVKSQIDQAWGNGGWAGAVDKLPQIIANIQASAGELQRGGVNPNDLIDYVYQTVGGFSKQNGQWVQNQ